MKNEISIIELFSGIGGFTRGFEKAGYTITKHAFSEIDKNAIANYQNNYNNAKYIGSVTTLRGEEHTGYDIITFGSPCQDFSMAGKRAGLDGQKSSLIQYAIEFIRKARPSVFIWENVKGAFSSNDGADFWSIIAAFADIGGYRLEWQLLNTSWFLPQNRERIYLIGHLTDRSTQLVFPITADDRPPHRQNEPNGQQQTAQNSSTLICKNGYTTTDTYILDTQIKQVNDKRNFGKSTKQQDRVYDSSGIMACLGAHRLEDKCKIVVQSVLTPQRLEKRQNGRRFKEEGEASFTLTAQDKHGVMITTNTKQGYDVLTENDTLNYNQPNSKTRRGRVVRGVANTLDTGCTQAVLEQSQIRRLTEIECERLQGFPDDWTKYGNYNGTIKEIAKTQRYKMLGNAVTVDVVAAIAKKLNIQ